MVSSSPSDLAYKWKVLSEAFHSLRPVGWLMVVIFLCSLKMVQLLVGMHPTHSVLLHGFMLLGFLSLLFFNQGEDLFANISPPQSVPLLKSNEILHKAEQPFSFMKICTIGSVTTVGF